MKNTHIRLAAAGFLCLGLLSFTPWLLAADTSDEATKVEKRLISALEEYNKKELGDPGKFFGGKKMLTQSLEAALKRRCDLDADPFTSAQDTVEGFLVKNTKMGEGVARITVIHKGSDKNDPENGWTFIMLIEDGLWKIDDIDWGDSTLKGSCR